MILLLLLMVSLAFAIKSPVRDELSKIKPYHQRIKIVSLPTASYDFKSERFLGIKIEYMSGAKVGIINVKSDRQIKLMKDKNINIVLVVDGIEECRKHFLCFYLTEDIAKALQLRVVPSVVELRGSNVVLVEGWQ